MARQMPSLLALLGLLAVAGYQNRDKIADAMKGLQNNTNTGRPGTAGTQSQGGLGSLLDGLGGMFGGAAGGGLAGGLGDLLESFKTSGQSDTADSWVTPGVPTKGLTPAEVERAIGDETLAELSARTGLSRDELLNRLATSIPESVDRLTPDGRFPTEEQARGYFNLS